jgi:hypothetical protein
MMVFVGWRLWRWGRREAAGEGKTDNVIPDPSPVSRLPFPVFFFERVLAFFERVLAGRHDWPAMGHQEGSSA